MAIGLGSTAGAGQPGPTVDLGSAVPPAQTGKPALTLPQPVAPPPDDCLPALPCGTRLYGAVQKNGAVELRVPAWRW